MDVEVLHWPTEAARRATLSAAGRPRLLLVPDGEAPPMPDDPLEDWARLSHAEEDVRARVATLAARAQAGRTTAPPELDDDGVLRVGERWVPLPPVELRLTRALLERLGAVVSRDALARAGWPDGAPGRNALDVHVLRLRRRLGPVGLAIRTVRSRGYLLESAESSGWRRPERHRDHDLTTRPDLQPA
jgi:DNA-binding winged helix-turn-helix (wHTH) protein